MQKRTLTRLRSLCAELDDLLLEADLNRASAFLQHGDTSVLIHCVAVAFYSMLALDILHVRYDRRALIRGALLHDFFLYDWHRRQRARREPMHAFSHPGCALQNARALVSLTPLEENIILRHMFPVTPVPPKSREGLTVCLIDKLCALHESLSRSAYPQLRRLCAHRIAAVRR